MTETLFIPGGAENEAQAHIDQLVRSWIGIPSDAATDVPRMPDGLARLLLRVEEHEVTHRDQWDGWEYSFSENYRSGCLWVPQVDQWVAEQRGRLRASQRLEPLWPDGRRFAMCLTHDVDMVSRQESPVQAARAVRAALTKAPCGPDSPSRRMLRGARSLARTAYFGVARLPDTSETLERCVQIERQYGVNSSYFFTVYPRRPTPLDCVYKLEDRSRWFGGSASVAEITRHIAADGSDVGLHGSYRSALDAELLAEEKARLEAAVQQKVETIRQHYLHFDVRATPQAQRDAGFNVDATLGFNRNIGFRAGTSMPFRPFDWRTRTEVDVLELPLVIQEAPLLRPNALELDAELARAVMRQLFESIEAVGGIATVLFHPHSLADPTYRELYRFSIEWGLERGAWIASAAQIGAWWRAREARLLRPVSVLQSQA